MSLDKAAMGKSIANESQLSLMDKISFDNVNNKLNVLLGTNPLNGINLYNNTTYTENYYVNYTNGVLAYSTSYCASDFIPVKPLTLYKRTVNSQIAYYDSNKTYISGLSESGKQFLTPANCYYVRLSIHNANKLTENMQQYFINVIPSINTYIGKNLYNYVTTSYGYFVNQITGELDTHANYCASDFIPVKPLTLYSRLNNLYMAFYDAKKTYLSGSVTAGKQFTTPANCYYIRSTTLTGNYLTEQIEEGAVNTTFEAYKFTPNQIESPCSLKLSLPAVIPAIVGCELNIYKQNICCVDNINNYQFVFTCSKGTHQNERWTYTPVVGDIGDITLTITIYKQFILVATTSTVIRVNAATKGTSQNPKVLIIGDSTTAGNTMITELASLFTSDADMDATFIGTQGVSPNLHEGYSGRTTNWMYTDASSPFVYSSAFNFATYLSTHSIDVPDIVILNLGINDMFAYTDDTTCIAAVAAMIVQYDAMITNIKLSNANVKIGVCMTIPSGNQDAFGSYGAAQTSWRYNRNNRILVKILAEYYRGKEALNIYVIPINVNLDTENNMLYASAAQINSRNTTTVARQTNGVHPGTFGYYQIADSMYYWIKSMAT